MSIQHNLFCAILNKGTLGLTRLTLQKTWVQLHIHNALTEPYLKIIEYQYFYL